MQDVIKKSLKHGETLFEVGDEGQCVYLLAEGEVALFSPIAGQPTEVERRGPGSVLGALSTLTNRPRRVTIRAVRDCTLYCIPAEHLLAEFNGLNPVLRACIDAAISLNGRISSPGSQATDQASIHGTVADITTSIETCEFQVDLINGIRNGEFSMVYQPIMSLTSNQIVGFEALMRWQQPRRGFVPPDEFIKLAERLGMVHHLTDIALQQTCKTLGHLSPMGNDHPPLFASINISGHDIARPDFPDQIAFNLERNDISPHQIKLEVTETAIIPDSAVVMENLAAIKRLGCGLSIDDFGTGYSNLSHLKSLPLSTLKIDRAFAGDAHANIVSRSIVSMLVALGQSLEVDVVAEGVETAEDVETLRDLGCCLAQGYFYYRPAPEAQLFDIINAQRDRGTDTAVA